MHFYDYASNCVDPAIYPRARFVSEFGFQSYPSFFVYKRYTQAKDWSIQSNMSDYRCDSHSCPLELFEAALFEESTRDDV